MAGVVCLAILETGERKKLVLPTGAHSELLAALAPFVPVNENTLLQIHDDDLDDFIDLEADAIIPTKAKIKVARKTVPHTDESMVAVQCTSPDTSFSSASDNAGPTNEVLGLSDGSSIVEVHVPLQKQFDYLDFKLPSFGPYEEVLQRKEPVGGPVRRAIINRLFQACFEIVWYPSKELYCTAVEQLIQKYPHLRDNVKKGSGMESWKVALKNKFKNNRKKAVNVSSEMQAVRAQSYRKTPREPVVEVANKKLCRLSNNNDLIIYGETLESRQKHNEWLQEHFATADPEDLRPRLLATAKERHECLRRVTLSEALLQYPFLATEHSLLMEFNILFKRTILDSIEQGCSRLCSIILDHAEQDEVVRFSAMAAEDGVLGVLDFIAGRCNESLDAILIETAAVPLTPCLQRASDGSLALHIDAQRLFVTSSLLAGLACLFASFWVFHVIYPKKAHRILTFIEHCFLDLSHTKPRVKALELVNFYKNFC
ncbi:uncharacterized protein [Dermacentor albipictus]|uniref:uncharacterized protein n=1 Tax=Dermacentor albipictus TaxID=60249 RepID=UPI0038FBE452